MSQYVLMNCMIEGCVREAKEGEHGLCHHCACYKKYRMRAWRTRTAKDRAAKRLQKQIERNKEKAVIKQQYREGQLKRLKGRKQLPEVRFGLAKSLAARRGLSWEIPLELYRSLVTTPCVYCGKPPHPTGVGLDRVDNRRGYLTDNSVPCCPTCNQIKGQHLTFEEMRAAMKEILAIRNVSDKVYYEVQR